MSKIFNIRFRNLTRRPVQLYEGREVLRDLLPGATIEMECTNPAALYSRWDEVDFTTEGIRLHQRRDWEEPQPPTGFVMVEFWNIEGFDLEAREIGGNQIFIPKGIPVRVFVTAADPLAAAKRVEVKRMDERVRSEFYDGYYKTERVLRDVIIPR